MPPITDYAFGRMTIGDTTYTKDLIIFPDGRVKSDWFRQSGHRLAQSDLDAVLSQGPSIIIAGTGAYGRMDIAPDLRETLKSGGIQLIAMETAKAAEEYNTQLKNKTAGLCGCFHLTC